MANTEIRRRQRSAFAGQRMAQVMEEAKFRVRAATQQKMDVSADRGGRQLNDPLMKGRVQRVENGPMRAYAPKASTNPPKRPQGQPRTSADATGGVRAPETRQLISRLAAQTPEQRSPKRIPSFGRAKRRSRRAPGHRLGV